MATYEINRDGSGLRKLTDDEIKRIPPPMATLRRTAAGPSTPQADDIFLFDNSTGAIRQITKTADAEVNPRFLPDGKRIIHARRHLFCDVAR